MADRSAKMLRRVLDSTFSLNDVPNILVCDKAVEFHDEDLRKLIWSKCTSGHFLDAFGE